MAVNINDPAVLDSYVIETPEMIELLNVDDVNGVRRAVLNHKIPKAMDRFGTNRCQRWTVGQIRQWNAFRATIALEESKMRFLTARRTSPR